MATSTGSAATAPVLRVGVIGAGGNTRQFHIPRLQAIAGVEIVSVSNRTMASGKAVAEQFGIPNVCESWKALLEDPAIDAVVIGTWPDTHNVLTCAALKAGKHVLCEARMARDVAEAREMLRTSQALPDLVAQLVPAPFTLKVDRTIHDMIAGGYLGEILAIDLQASTAAFIDRAAPLAWRSDFGVSGYNTMTMGIWYETLMRWVGEATRLTAMSKVFVKQRRHPSTGHLASIRIPDHVDIIADMACGAQATLRFSAVTGLPGSAGSVWIHGSEGTLHFDRPSGRLSAGRRGDAALAEVAIAPEKAGEWQVEEDFVNSIRLKQPVRLTSFADGVRYMEFTEAVTRSAMSGRTVDLPLGNR